MRRLLKNIYLYLHIFIKKEVIIQLFCDRVLWESLAQETEPAREVDWSPGPEEKPLFNVCLLKLLFIFRLKYFFSLVNSSP